MAVIVVFAFAWFGAAALAPASGVSAGGITSHLARVEVGASALALVAGSAHALRWKIDGYAPSWWIGMALVVAGIPPITTSASSNAFHTLHAACGVVAACALLCALRSPEVDTTIRPGVTLGGVITALVGLTVVFVSNPASTHLALGIVFTLTAVVAAIRLRGAPEGPWRALIPFLIGLAIADIFTGVVPAESAVHVAGAALIRLVATVFPLVGAIRDLRAAAALQRTAAYGETLQREAAQMLQRSTEERYAETLHEVRSTVVALEGGVRGLVPRDDAPISPALARALTAEVERLRTLVSDDSDRTAVRYRAAEALEPVLTVARAGGVPVSWHVPSAMWVRGRAADLAQIVHALLTNATRYAPGSPIEVTAEQDGVHVAVRVSDRGPGVPTADAERIFTRGARGATCDAGEGLGLYIARNVACKAGGDLWVEPRLGGGASFVVALPVGDGVAARSELKPGSPAIRAATRPAPRRRDRVSWNYS